MKNGTMRKLTAMLLVMILCVGILPFAAFASDDGINDNGEPVAEETTEKPAEEQITEKPAEEQITEKPAAEQITEKPAAEQITEKPAEEQITEKPAAEQITEKPAVEQITEKPAAEQITEKPAAEQITEKPAAEQITEKPIEEEKEDTLSIPQAPEKPEEPQAPEAPDVSGLAPQEANALIDAYNARVDAYNAEIEAYNQAMELYEQQAQAYNAQVEAYNREAEILNAQADEHNANEAQLQAESDARMAEYQKRLDTYERNVATLERIDERNSALAQQQMESLGDIHRVDRESILELGTVLDEPYSIGFGRFTRQIGQPGDLLISWDDLAPTLDRNTITVEAGEASGNTYKVANLHIFDDFKNFTEKNEYMEENGYDCMNIEFDDENNCLIIPRELIDRMVMMELEVAEADANDTVTVTAQNTLFAGSMLFTLSRYLDGYTQGVYWYNGGSEFYTNSGNYYQDDSLTGHTFDFVDGTCDNSSIKNVLNINQYTCFARYSNPQPVKPEEYTAQMLQHTETLNLLDARANLLTSLSRMTRLSIPAPEPVQPVIPELPVIPAQPETPVRPTAPVRPAPVDPQPVKEPEVEEPEELEDPQVPLAIPETVSQPQPAPLVSVKDHEPKVEILPEPELPAAAPAARSWALVNLIAAILTALTGLWMALNAGKKRLDETRYLNRLLGLLPAVGSPLVFLLTEDIRSAMVLTDRWTLAMVALLGVALGLAFLTRDEKRETA